MVSPDQRGATDAPPRYRIEHRDPNLASLVVAFVDTPTAVDFRAALCRQRLRRQGACGELAVVDQDTGETVRTIRLDREP